MCGIVGYFGHPDQTLDTLINGLRRLEYRGYDSAGIAITQSDGKVFVEKSIGKVVELEKKIANIKNLDNLFTGIGIAHTRWATHGSPSTINAHPHQSYNKKVLLVHNGIIENFAEIKNNLQTKGYEFYSDTDTEVLANLIDFYYSGNLKQAIQNALLEVRGAYAIAVVSPLEPTRLIAAKIGAPLVVGMGTNEFIIASDVSAIIGKTRDVIYLEDGEMVDLDVDTFKITTFDDKELLKDTQYIDWNEEEATKEGYDHFLLKEIFEQPKAVIDTTRGRLLPNEADIKFGGLLDINNKMSTIDNITLVGVGTSYYACRLGEMYFESLTKLPTRAEMSPEYRYKTTLSGNTTWGICVSQSGETADTIGCIQEMKKKGSLVTGIVNTVGSTIARITHNGVYQHIGPELSVASTKAFTSASLLLLMHAISVGRQRGLDFTDAENLVRDIALLPKYIQSVLDHNKDIESIAHKYYQSQNFIYIGRHYNYPIAQEGALKLKELSYIHAEGMSSGELKHGSIALIDNNIPTVAICTQDAFFDKQVSTIQEVIARNGPVIAIVNDDDNIVQNFTPDIIRVPKTLTSEIQPLVSNIAQQLFAYHIANKLGVDIDKPRNLAKSVTVE